MRHARKCGRRAASRSASEATGSAGTLAELKKALRERDARLGYVPNRTPFAPFKQTTEVHGGMHRGAQRGCAL